tara:strand:- start:214 stop:528 length:315 start_codon:yes stop_codon:yes gene_type:complete
MAKKQEKTVTTRDYDVIVRPLVTEKSTMGSEHSKVTFVVAKDATKPEIKHAVESLFKVTVESVNTLILKGKSKRFRGRLGQRSDTKKAIITLKDGQTIDLATGL